MTKQRSELTIIEYVEVSTSRESVVPGMTDCWVWQRAKSNGYGTWRRRSDGKWGEYAHRVSYQAHKGEIPDGLQLDHLCRNRACVNPEHLEPVTQLENIRRAAAADYVPSEVFWAPSYGLWVGRVNLLSENGKRRRIQVTSKDRETAERKLEAVRNAQAGAR